MSDAAVWHVVSRDGTEIGVFSSGAGPPLVLVHGGLGDHTRWDALRPYLEPHVTVHAMDRRGRGVSEDGPAYRLEREVEDVVAVVETVADRSGSRVAVYGHSFGGLCALGAAALTPSIDRLVLYEGWPPVDPAAWAVPPGFLERLEELLSAGDREAVLETFLRGSVKMTDQDIDRYRHQRSWRGRVAAAHTIIREERAFQERAFDPEDAAGVTVPTLLMVGEEQPLDWQVETVRGSLFDARICVLDGRTRRTSLRPPSSPRSCSRSSGNQHPASQPVRLGTGREDADRGRPQDTAQPAARCTGRGGRTGRVRPRRRGRGPDVAGLQPADAEHQRPRRHRSALTRPL